MDQNRRSLNMFIIDLYRDMPLCVDKRKMMIRMNAVYDMFFKTAPNEFVKRLELEKSKELPDESTKDRNVRRQACDFILRRTYPIYTI